MNVALSSRVLRDERPQPRLIGRESEVAAIIALLGRLDVRLVTLTGPGGVGKTRLARQVMDEARDCFDEVAFVPLAAIHDPDLVVPTIARVCDVPEAGETPLAQRLALALARRRRLLVLDNLEQVPEAAARLGDLLSRAAPLSILATSRVRLGLDDEQELAVSPLAAPDARSRRLPPLSARDAETFGAVALFVERAKEADRRFFLTDENADVVAAICRRLDGLPLAIELAAARLRLLSAPALLELLEHRMALLTGGPRDEPDRLRTMRDSIAWSYDLLDARRQTLFRRLSVFEDGFTLEAAVAVVNGVGDGAPQGESTSTAILEDVLALGDHNLLAPDEAATGNRIVARFMMLETIRAFGLEQLAASGGEAAVRRRLAAWFLGLAERAEPNLSGPDERRWLDLLETESANLRGALGWLLENDAQGALRMGSALWLYWYRSGRVTEGEAWVGAALAKAGAPDPVRAKAEFVHGALAGMSGRWEAAVERLDACLPLLRAGDDRVVEALAETSRGLYALLSGHPAEAVSSLDRADTLYHHGATPMARSLGTFARCQLGLALHVLGDSEAGLRYCEEALGRLRTIGAPAVLPPALSILATIHWNRGDIDRANAAWREALTLAVPTGESWTVIDPLFGLAAVAAERGEVRTALRLQGAVDVWRQIAGTTAQIATAMSDRIETAAAANLSPEAIAAERAAGAAASLEEIVAVVLDADEPRGTAAQLTPREREILRLLAAGRSDPQIAATLFVSRRTVATHVANLFKKLGVHSRAAASAEAVRRGLA